MNPNLTRREVLAWSVAAAGASAVLPGRAEAIPMPKRPLGRTGVHVPILAMGGGTRFFTPYDEETGAAALNLAIDLGVTYLDTANSYGNGRSETIYGSVMKTRRKEVFLATKLKARDCDGALRQFEESLKRLQTDHVDLLHIHRVDDGADLAAIEARGGVLEALYRLREQKAARWIGITAHADPQPLKLAIERNDFDCVQMPLNAALSGESLAGFKPPNPGDRAGCFETVVLPVARRKNMGILAMKVCAQARLIGAPPHKDGPEQLLRYTWSLPVATAVVGMNTPDMLRQNAAWARTHSPMSEDEMRRMSDRLAPANKVVLDRFFAHHDDLC